MAKRLKPLILTRNANDNTSEIQWSPDGKWLVAVGGAFDVSPKLVFWNTQTWKTDDMFRLKGFGSQTCDFTRPYFSKDGDQFAIAGEKVAQVYQTNSRKCILTLPLIPKDAGPNRAGIKRTETKVTSLCFNDAGTRLAAGTWDCHAKIWDLKTGALNELQPDHEDNVELVSFLNDGKTLMSVTSNEAWLWDVKALKVRKKVKLKYPGTACCMSRTNDALWVGTFQSQIVRWTLSTWKAASSRLKPGVNPFCVVASPVSDVVGMVMEDCTAVIWDVGQKREIVRLGKKWGDTLQSLSFSPDGRQVALSFNNSLQVFDLSALK